MWVLWPCLVFLPGRWAWKDLLCNPLPELGEGRDQEHLKSEGAR